MEEAQSQFEVTPFSRSARGNCQRWEKIKYFQSLSPVRALSTWPHCLLVNERKLMTKCMCIYTYRNISTLGGQSFKYKLAKLPSIVQLFVLFFFDLSPKSVLWKHMGLLMEVSTVCFHQFEGTGLHIMQFCNTTPSISQVKSSPSPYSMLNNSCAEYSNW